MHVYLEKYFFFIPLLYLKKKIVYLNFIQSEYIYAWNYFIHIKGLLYVFKYIIKDENKNVKWKILI